MKYWVLFLIAVMSSSSGFCYSEKELDSLKEVHVQLNTIGSLIAQGVLDADDKKVVAMQNASHAQADKIVGHPVGLAEVDAIISASSQKDEKSGFSLFLVILIVMAGAALAIAVGGLASYYLWPLLVQVPATFYEMLAYAFSSLLLAAGYLFKPVTFLAVTIQPVWFVIPGAFVFAACIVLTRELHFSESRGESSSVGLASFPVVISGLCCVVWGLAAIGYHSLMPDARIPYFMGFISVMALQSALGFSVITMPGAILLGWERDDIVPRSTVASFHIMVICLVAKLTGETRVPFQVFETGGLFMGAFVYYLGLLVLSNKFYIQDKANYAPMQLLVVASGFAAFYIGATYGVSILLGVGGTFFVIYLLEKYYEIPWEGVGWFWSLLGVAVGMYFLVGFAAQHPAYFLWTMPY